jgi:hypothetical protein
MLQIPPPFYELDARTILPLGKRTAKHCVR